MSNPWEAPDHTNPVHGPQHHATPNPTAPSSDPGMLGAGAVEAGWRPPVVTQDPRLAAAYANYRFLWGAILLAVCLGPIGVFYLGLLHGVAASVVVLAVGRTLFGAIRTARGASPDDVTTVVLGLAVVWGISIPWAIVGTRMANARRARRQR
jgi:hypothetical protein